MKIGDRIFYQKDGEFYIDRIADIYWLQSIGKQ